jgi:FHS family L-fucose permease-like MFS transporter
MGVLILQWLDPALLLTIHALMCFIASMGVALASGWGGVAFLYILFFFESVCYPVRISRVFLASPCISYTMGNI